MSVARFLHLVRAVSRGLDWRGARSRGWWWAGYLRKYLCVQRKYTVMYKYCCLKVVRWLTFIFATISYLIYHILHLLGFRCWLILLTEYNEVLYFGVLCNLVYSSYRGKESQGSEYAQDILLQTLIQYWRPIGRSSNVINVNRKLYTRDSGNCSRLTYTLKQYITRSICYMLVFIDNNNAFPSRKKYTHV